MELAAEVQSALERIVGSPNVLVDASRRHEYETATFDTSQHVLAIVLPASTSEVQQIVTLANQHRLPLYPVSRGRNWGLGSRVPLRDQSLVVDLRRMNRIVDFDESLSCVTVEPGVTFRQLSDFLGAKRSKLYLSVIGGPPDASVVGNTVERGDGLGPLGDRSEQCCAFEVVLGTGELLRTGMAAFGDGTMARLLATGVGPELTGLFIQSNFGIVTRLTIWLARRPRAFQGMAFALDAPGALEPVLTGIRDLQQRGVIRPNSFALWNMHKFLASGGQYPFDAAGEPLASPEELLAHVPTPLRGVRWIGMGALYSASGPHARADRHAVRAALRGNVSNLTFVGRDSGLRRARPPSFPGITSDRLIKLLYSESPFVGNPTEFSIQSVYWRKRGTKPAHLDPDRDRCGLHWVCTAVAFQAEQVARHSELVERIAHDHGLEPNLSYLNISERYLRAFVVIAFDRDAGDEEQRARSCHDEMLRRLIDAGYPAVRLGIQSMAAVSPSESDHTEWLRRLKQQFDPNDVLAPGRYDFRHSWAAPDA